MTPPRFQFSIRNLLWAMFWVAVGMPAWSAGPEVYFRSTQPYLILQILIPFVQVGALVMAPAALFGRMRWGILAAVPLGALWSWLINIAMRANLGG